MAYFNKFLLITVITGLAGTFSSFKTTDTGNRFYSTTDSLSPVQIRVSLLFDSLKKELSTKPKFTIKEEKLIKQIKKEVDSYLKAGTDSLYMNCREKNCIVFAEIDKSEQILYLYLFGELTDTFKVSTGLGDEYQTPELCLHPQGPMYIKYTSKKFPGGSYKGLGNMPYAVFLTNGYAIHGTTPGNFSKLGSMASHGCIRLHPDNGKYFYALVKIAGLKQTWVNVRDSLPD